MDQKTTPLYQKDGNLSTHTSTISSIQPLSSLPSSTQSLFKPPPGTPYILTTPSTIFHAQGGGQPSDVGKISSTSSSSTFLVHQVRKVDPAILHVGTFEESEGEVFKVNEEVKQELDISKRTLHSRLHTAGHILGLAINQLITSGNLPPNIIDGKASHYPGAAFVEFTGLIPSDAKPLIQAKVDEMVALDLDVKIAFWTEERARKECLGVGEGVELKGDEDGVRIVDIGGRDGGCYACGGTHVVRTGECGKVVVRGVKRQKGVSKVGYEVKDA